MAYRYQSLKQERLEKIAEIDVLRRQLDIKEQELDDIEMNLAEAKKEKGMFNLAKMNVRRRRNAIKNSAIRSKAEKGFLHNVPGWKIVDDELDRMNTVTRSLPGQSRRRRSL